MIATASVYLCACLSVKFFLSIKTNQYCIGNSLFDENNNIGDKIDSLPPKAADTLATASATSNELNKSNTNLANHSTNNYNAISDFSGYLTAESKFNTFH